MGAFARVFQFREGCAGALSWWLWLLRHSAHRQLLCGAQGADHYHASPPQQQEVKEEEDKHQHWQVIIRYSYKVQLYVLLNSFVHFASFNWFSVSIFECHPGSKVDSIAI